MPALYAKNQMQVHQCVFVLLVHSVLASVLVFLATCPKENNVGVNFGL